MAGPGDEPRLWDFCVIAHADNGVADFSPKKVQAVIHAACRRPDDYPPTVFALIDGPDRIKAGVCLQASQCWYSETWNWVDLLFFVDPRYRRSRERLAEKLFQFVLQWDQDVARPGGARVIMSIETLYYLPNKLRLFGRYGHQIGASFLIGDLPAETAAGTA